MAWCRGEASSPTTSFCFSGHLSFVHFLKKGISIIIQSNLKHTHACIKCIWMREMIRYIYQIFVWPECLKNKQRRSAKPIEDNDHNTFSLTTYLIYFSLMPKETYSLVTCWKPLSKPIKLKWNQAFIHHITWRSYVLYIIKSYMPFKNDSDKVDNIASSF